MPNTEHERELCDLIAGLYLQQVDETLERTWYPEDDIPPIPNPVDAVYSTDAREYVVEHTTLESYHSQITEDHKISQLLRIEQDLCRRITSHGRYEIRFNTETLKDKRISKVLIENLCNWVAQKAPTLEIGGPRTAPRHMVTDVLSIEGRSIEVSLSRWPGMGVSVKVFRAIPENQEEKLLLQVQASMGKKIPKLIDWKQNRHASSILILESIDPSLVSGPAVARATCAAIRKSAEKPDTIYIAKTDRDKSEVWELVPPFDTEHLVDKGVFKLKKGL